jgi:hypothetical protein
VRSLSFLIEVDLSWPTERILLTEEQSLPQGVKLGTFISFSLCFLMNIFLFLDSFILATKMFIKLEPNDKNHQLSYSEIPVLVNGWCNFAKCC